MEDQGGAGGAPLHEGDSEHRRPHVKPSVMDRRRKERESASDTASQKRSDETRRQEGTGKDGQPPHD